MNLQQITQHMGSHSVLMILLATQVHIHVARDTIHSVV